MRYYYYLSEGVGFIRIKRDTKPRYIARTYVIQGLDGLQWVTPCFPEISWGQLNTMRYIGSELIEETN